MSDFLTWAAGAFFGWYCAKWAYAYSGWKKERKARRMLAEQTLAVEAGLARRYEREAK